MLQDNLGSLLLAKFIGLRVIWSSSGPWAWFTTIALLIQLVL